MHINIATITLSFEVFIISTKISDQWTTTWKLSNDDEKRLKFQQNADIVKRNMILKKTVEKQHQDIENFEIFHRYAIEKQQIMIIEMQNKISNISLKKYIIYTHLNNVKESRLRKY